MNTLSSYRRAKQEKIDEVHASSRTASEACKNAAAAEAEAKLKLDALSLKYTAGSKISPPVMAPVAAGSNLRSDIVKPEPGVPDLSSPIVDMEAVRETIQKDIPPHVMEDEYDQDQAIHELFLKLNGGKDLRSAIRDRYQSAQKLQQQTNLKRSPASDEPEGEVGLDYLQYLEDTIIVQVTADDIEPAGVDSAPKSRIVVDKNGEDARQQHRIAALTE